MYSIFFSTVTDTVFICLLRGDSVITTICENNSLLHSENFVSKLNQLVTEVNLTLRDIKQIYFLSGPGSQTGERVAFSFVTIMKILDPQVELFTLDSLSFQASLEQDCLSVISIGKNSKKYCINRYQQGTLLLSENRVSEERFTEIVEQFRKANLLIDYQNVDFLSCFQISKTNFRKFEGIK